MNKPIKISSFLSFLIILLVANACNTTKELAPGESFLVKNEIVFSKDKEEKIKEKRSLSYELETLYKQRPNENFFGIPGVSKRWFWYRNNDPEDTTKFKRFIKRKIAEAPAVFKDEKAYETAKTMEFYLQNRGYFGAQVYHVKDRTNKKGYGTEVTYHVSPNKQYLVDTIRYISQDTTIKSILEQMKKESVLQPGDAVDGKLYEQEVARISKYLRNNGYAYFYPNYIAPLSGDSLNHRVEIDLEVLVPNNQTKHKTYRVGEIYVYPQYDIKKEVLEYQDTIIDGVHFMLPNGEDFAVKPQVILNNLYLTAGELYNQSKFDKTNRSLGNLGVYKFVSIKEDQDLLEEDILNFKIFLTTSKVFEIGTDGEVNTSSATLIGQRFIGAGAGLSLKHRNMFKGSETFIINTDLNFDFNVNQFNNLDSLVNTLDFKIQGDLYLPKFVDYFGAWKSLNKLRLISDNFYKQLRENSNTHIFLGYNYIDRFGFYRLKSLTASFGYEIPPTRTQRYSLNHFGVNFVKPITELGIDTILSENPFLERSFDQQLFTGVLLRNLGYTYTSPVSRLGESFSLFGNLEISGLEIYAANQLYNSFATDPKTFEIIRRKATTPDTTAFSQFVLLEVDAKVFRQINKKQKLAFRFYAGAGVPFGFSDDVPYVKQFFVGGPNSMRAWTARELGPGGYIDPQTLEANANPLLFYQTGDFKLEFNAEYRVKLFDILGFSWEGALFVDVGNIYTLKEDLDRPFSKLVWQPEYRLVDGDQVKVQENFIKQLGVGSGFGLRIDFAYFILRLDTGFPLRNPYTTTYIENGVSVPRNWRRVNSYGFRDLNFNLGLGYPF